MLTKYPQQSRESASRVIAEEAVVVDSQEGLARVLNPTATRIWELVDGRRRIQEIAAIIAAEFAVSPEQAEDDTLDFLKELAAQKMVVINDEPGA